MHKIAAVILGCLLLSATAAVSENRFAVTASNGISFDQDSKYAQIKWANPDAWSFAAGILNFRIQGFRMGDEPVAETQELVNNNTGFSFKTEIDGTSVAIGCRGSEDLVGWVKRTELTEERVSGSFRVELVRCLDYYTADPVAYEPLPIIVEGTFSVERKDW